MVTWQYACLGPSFRAYHDDDCVLPWSTFCVVMPLRSIFVIFHSLFSGKRGRSKGLNAVTKPPASQPCRVCEKEIEYKDAFSHMETAHGVLDECPFCPGTYRKLQRHISKVHNPKPALYCEVCGACFRTHSSLKGHRLNQHFKDQKRHVCDVCRYLH